ncbi:hypothetical protein LEP1GSC005_3228 [Leptospira santarosai str. ST188]|nr:hypothetical protein LEP1GSC005_3228 [Leptospira santarosai str. ST188]EMO71793.1 hypothetical protein LEP1GSC130_0852 [Leptospira santarosai str. 200403458]EMO99015.1 hypothetical protein LEP1GSC120_1763 [Leptospira santarosai str. 200702252]
MIVFRKMNFAILYFQKLEKRSKFDWKRFRSTWKWKAKDFTNRKHEKNIMLRLFQNLECETLSKKPTILGLAQFREDFHIFKKIPR